MLEGLSITRGLLLQGTRDLETQRTLAELELHHSMGCFLKLPFL